MDGEQVNLIAAQADVGAGRAEASFQPQDWCQGDAAGHRPWFDIPASPRRPRS